MENFTIVNGRLKGCRPCGETVIIPNSVDSIDKEAFADCRDMKRLSIPETVYYIRPEAFSGCRSLEEITVSDENPWFRVINGTLIQIADAVWDREGSVCKPEPSDPTAILICTSEREYRIPDSVVEVYSSCCMLCGRMRDLWIPGSLRRFYADLKSCNSLKTVHCEVSVPGFYLDGIPAGCRFAVSDAVYRNLELFQIEIQQRAEMPSAEMLPYILLAHHTKGWREYLKKYPITPAKLIRDTCECMRSMKKVKASHASHVIDYMMDVQSQLKAEEIRSVLDTFEDKCPKAYEKLRMIPEFQQKMSGKPENPVESQIKKTMLLSHFVIPETIRKSIQRGIAYADGSGVSSPEALALPIALYAEYFDKHAMKERGEFARSVIRQLRTVPEILPDADKIAAALDRQQLSEFLLQKVEENTYRDYILAFARYGTEEHIKAFIERIKPRSKGKAKEKYWAENAQNALYLSDTMQAGYYMDSLDRMDEYAALRGFTKNEYRDVHMLPTFGMDQEGSRILELGDNRIRVSIGDDLKLKLYDIAHNKEVKNLPARGTDAQTLNSAKNVLKDLKTELETFLQQRTAVLLRMYWDGEEMSGNLWKTAYFNHPVLKRIAELLIWRDEENRTFTVDQGRIVDAKGSGYEPKGRISLAHVLDMDYREVDSWQKYLVSFRKKQLFDQIWEPVCLSKDEVSRQRSRYAGAVITQKERNAFKKQMKAKGIPVSAEEMEKIYDPRTGGYIFSNEGSLRIGAHIILSYRVDEESKDLTFGSMRLLGRDAYKELNSVVYALDLLTIRHQVAMDRTEILNDKRIEAFTAAQISDLLQYAIEQKATNCTAALLEYKQCHFGFSAAMDEFIL